MKFMQTHKVYLTPISPIHIGCGEDFEPTNYVIDGSTLFHFDPANLALNTSQRTELSNYVNRLDLLAIQRFFLKNKEQAISSAYYFADVAEGLANDYKNKVDKVTQRESDGNKVGKVAQRESDGNNVINKLSIERTAFLPVKHLPYIPGSGFKGALATALLDSTHQAKGNPKVRKEDHGKLLKEYIGEFADSKLRFVKFGDFTPIGEIQSKIYYSINFKRQLKEDGDKNGKGITTRRETINLGQYRILKSELTLLDSKQTIQDYFKVLKDFHLPIFQKEAQILIERKLVSVTWLKNVEKLILHPNVSLVRLGKNGSESKSYRGKDVAKIDIKGTPRTSPTTVWLAGNYIKQQNELLPFGWAIIEVDPIADNEELKKWCEAQPKSNFDRSSILAKREAHKAEQIRLKAEEEAKQQAKIAEEQAKAEMLNSLSDNQRLIVDFVEKLKETRERQADNTGSPLLKEAEALINQATEWDIADRQFVFEQITADFLKSKIDFKKKDTEKNVKKWRNKLGIE